MTPRTVVLESSDRGIIASATSLARPGLAGMDPQILVAVIEQAGDRMATLEQSQAFIHRQTSVLLDRIREERRIQSVEIGRLTSEITRLKWRVVEAESRAANAERRAASAERRADAADLLLNQLQDIVSAELGE